MKKLVLLASLLATACSVAQAEGPAAPSPPPPPPPSANPRPLATCARSGDVLFEQAELTEQRVAPTGLPTSKTIVFTSGGWSRVSVDGKGKITSSITGCLAKADVDTIRDDLARAKWTITQADVACAAISATYVAYSSRGKHLWDQHMCSLNVLDATSQTALNEIVAILTKVTTPITPPCCKK